jgi:hypothetical protein
LNLLVQLYSNLITTGAPSRRSRSSSLARVRRAQALYALGRREEAMADYSAALILDPKLLLVWANRAVLRHQAGRRAEALADLTWTRRSVMTTAAPKPECAPYTRRTVAGVHEGESRTSKLRARPAAIW